MRRVCQTDSGFSLLYWRSRVGVLPAQEFSPGYVDARPVLEAAAEAIGADNLKCVTISGHGYAGMVGQQRLHAYEVDWPRGEPLAKALFMTVWRPSTRRAEKSCGIRQG